MAGSVGDQTSPFHKGEQQVQERFGVRDMIEAFARRVVRDHLPDQHREFYGNLPFIMLGTVDDKGRPWASIVPGRPGFITSPDAVTLRLAALPLHGDPLHDNLQPGGDVGLLGIELATRRRNRITGKIKSVSGDGFSIAIGQTFGNCPQYIQNRAVEVRPEIEGRGTGFPVHRSDRFDGATRALIEQSDTLFIASAYSEDRNARSQGADVSHRGGKPGFVKVEDDRTFVFPDFSGNNHYNTIGNFTLNPKAGFLFMDFDEGDVWSPTEPAIVFALDPLSEF